MSLRVYYTLRKQSRKTGITVRITKYGSAPRPLEAAWVSGTHTHTQWNKNDQWCLWHYCTSLVFFIRGSFLLKYDKLSSPHTHAYTVMFSLSGIPLHTDQLKKRIFFNPNGSFDEVFLFSCTRNKNNIWSLGIVAWASVNLINIVKT